MTDSELRVLAQRLAYSLGIPLWVTCTSAALTAGTVGRSSVAND
jgi:hypothetical protein